MAAGAPAVLARSNGWAAHRRAVHLLKADITVPPGYLQGLKQHREELAFTHVPVVNKLMSGYVGREVTVSPLTGLGTFHCLFGVEDELNNRYIMRTSLLSEVDGTPDFILDCWVASLARHAKFPVSIPCWVDITLTAAPFPFEVFTANNAVTVKELENSATQELPEGVAFEMGRTLAAIHSVRAAGSGPLDVAALTDDECTAPTGVHDSWREFIELNLLEHLNYCKAASAVTVDEAREIEHLFSEMSPLYNEVEISLLHGDYSGSNLFTDGKRITAVIDWEDARAGDPVYDIAAWATFYRETIHPEFLDGYTSVRSAGTNFDVKFWLYFLRVSLAKTAHRYRFGVTDVPGRPAASRRILQSLERLRTVVNS